jgi:hypothetical protein
VVCSCVVDLSTEHGNACLSFLSAVTNADLLIIFALKKGRCYHGVRMDLCI